jgi:hypothetical protein
MGKSPRVVTWGIGPPPYSPVGERNFRAAAAFVVDALKPGPTHRRLAANRQGLAAPVLWYDTARCSLAVPLPTLLDVSIPCRHPAGGSVGIRMETCQPPATFRRTPVDSYAPPPKSWQPLHVGEHQPILVLFLSASIRPGHQPSCEFYGLVYTTDSVRPGK